MYPKHTAKIGSSSQANKPIDNFPPPSSSEPNVNLWLFSDSPKPADQSEPVELMIFDEPTAPADQSEPVELMTFDERFYQSHPNPVSIPNDSRFLAETHQKHHGITWERIIKILNPDPCSSPKSISSDNIPVETTDLKSWISGMSSTFPPQRQNTNPINHPIDPQIFSSTGDTVDTSVTVKHFIHPNSLSAGYHQQMSPCTQGVTHVQPIQGMTVYPRRQGKEPKSSVSPYKAHQKLVSQYYFKVFEGSLYIFQNGVYHFLDTEMAKTLIMALCADELSVVGQPRFIAETLEFLLTSARNKIVEGAINKNLICFDNGLIDIQSNTAYPATPDTFTTHRLLCAFTPQHMGCPSFDRFLHQACGGDPVLIERIWEYIGYNLTPGNPAKKIFVLQGKANSGKSLLTNFLASLFPHNCVTSLGIHSLERTFALESLIGKKLCISGDLPASPLRSKTISLLK